jgi:hypothetical protein
MAVPIVNDWKAIHDRMRQISAEEASVHAPCPLCQDVGWTNDRFSNRRDTYRICRVCHNPKDLPRPVG